MDDTTKTVAKGKERSGIKESEAVNHARKHGLSFETKEDKERVARHLKNIRNADEAVRAVKYKKSQRRGDKIQNMKKKRKR